MAGKKRAKKVGKAHRGRTRIHPGMEHLIGKTLRKKSRKKVSRKHV